MRGHHPTEAVRSDRQQRICAFLRTYQAAHGYPPTRREISQELGWLSLATLTTELAQLAEHRRITVTPGAARGIVLVAG